MKVAVMNAFNSLSAQRVAAAAAKKAELIDPSMMSSCPSPPPPPPDLSSQFHQFLSKYVISFPAVSQSLFYAGILLSGFLFEFKPSEPFLTPYLLHDKNISDDDLNDVIYPVWTYCNFAFLFLVLFLNQFLRYRIIIILDLSARVITRVILIWGSTVQQFQATQITFGFATAAEIIYYSYIYQLFPLRNYVAVTGHIRAATLLGHVIAGYLGQILVSSGVGRPILFYISMVTVLAGAAIFIMTPWLAEKNSSKTEYSQLREEEEEEEEEKLEKAVAARIEDGFFVKLQRDVKQLFTILGNWNVLICSVYLWLGDGVLQLVLNYNTSLFDAIDSTVDYNGVVIASGRLCAALASLLPLYTVNFMGKLTNFSMIAAAICTAGSLILYWMSASGNLDLAYGLFVLFYGIMTFIYTVAVAQVAQCINLLTGNSSAYTAVYGLVFTFNTLISTGIQVILQIIIGRNGLHLDIYKKFHLFSIELAIVAVIFIGSAVFVARKKIESACLAVKVSPHFADSKAELLVESNHYAQAQA
jgi:thiamine transporter 2/3